MDEIITLFDEAGMFFIATCEGDQPRLRPFGGLMKYQDHLYFNTSNQKHVYQELMKNPKIELCTFHKGTWLRVQANTKRATTPELVEEMFRQQPAVAKMYQKKQDEFEVIELTDIIARKNTFTNMEVIYTEE